jgi:uncharacterized membrane protein
VVLAVLFGAFCMPWALVWRQDTGAGAPARRVFVLDGIPYPALVFAQRSADARRAMLAYARKRWPLATLGGLASLGSYWIALWAMTRAPVAAVSALRETSVLFATALSVLVLKERFGLQRASGAVIIVAGVIALRLS